MKITFPVLVITMFCASLWAVEGDLGVTTEPLTDGSATYPYLIEDLADFDIFAGNPSYWAMGVHTRLKADIDLSGRTYPTAVIAPDTDNTNYSFEGTAFAATFDGHGHQIRNLTINLPGSRNDYWGLFGCLASTAEIKNLGLVNVDIDAGLEQHVIGALCGENSGNISHCFVEGFVSGHWAIGGLVGNNRRGSISHCRVNGLVIGDDEVGGLAGANLQGTIVNCCASGTVDGGMGGYEIGGLVGGNWEDAVISQSYANNSVIGGDLVGGLAGYNKNVITKCYAAGSVTGYSETVGGLAGGSWLTGEISHCYAAGRVQSGTFTSGGLVGFGYWDASHTVRGSFWDIETTGKSISAGGTGLTTDQMQNINTYLHVGWDFVGETANGTKDVWFMRDGMQYPLLFASRREVDQANMIPAFEMFPGSVYDNQYQFPGSLGTVEVTLLGNTDLIFSVNVTGLAPDSRYKVFFDEDGIVPNVVSTSNNWKFKGDYWSDENGQGQWIYSMPINHFEPGTHVKSVFINRTDINRTVLISYNVEFKNPNTPPIADAGTDVTTYAWIDGLSEVTLNGSDSYDDDGDPLQYFWYNDAGELIATGPEPDVAFGVGAHEVTLIVNDGIEDSQPDSCVVTVIEALEGQARILPKSINRKRHGRYVIGWFRLPEGVDADQLNPDEPLLLLAGETEIQATKQSVMGGRGQGRGQRPVSILAFFDTQTLLDAVEENGTVELTLATRLESGQTTYGTDRVRFFKLDSRPRKQKTKQKDKTISRPDRTR